MANLNEERKAFEALGLSYAVSEQVTVGSTVLAGVQNYWFTPPRVEGSEVVVFLHGGGYIYGSIQSHRAMVSHIAAATGRKILYVEYSLAPEKPFPHALNETTAVIQTLLCETPGMSFALMGDSAGGNLVMSTVLNLKKLNVQAPLYQVLVSPWLNMKTEYSSYRENEKLDPIISREFVAYAASQYAGNGDLTNPLISPIHGSFKGLNPTLILVGAKEVLRDDSVFLHRALVIAGVTSVLKVFENVTHVWTLTSITSDDSRQALQTMHEFMTSVIRKQPMTA